MQSRTVSSNCFELALLLVDIQRDTRREGQVARYLIYLTRNGDGEAMVEGEEGRELEGRTPDGRRHLFHLILLTFKLGKLTPPLALASSILLFRPISTPPTRTRPRHRNCSSAHLASIERARKHHSAYYPNPRNLHASSPSFHHQSPWLPQLSLPPRFSQQTSQI